MREILFRGRRDNGEWVYGYPLYDMADCSLQKQGQCQCSHGGELIAFFAWIDDLHEYGEVEVDPSTVGQYIRRTDKDGTKIFEGDIVDVFFYHGKKDAWRVVVDDIRRIPDIMRGSSVEYVKVVGNIRDNPELLRQKDGEGTE